MLSPALATKEALARWPDQPDQTIAVSLPASISVLDACPDGAGGAFVAWIGGHTWIHHVDMYGDSMFVVGPWDAGDFYVHLGPDGAGGVIASLDGSESMGNSLLALQHISGQGSELWSRVVARSDGHPFGACMTADRSGTLVAWADRHLGRSAVRAFRADSAGQPSWGDSALVVATIPPTGTVWTLTADPAGGWWVTYTVDSSPAELRVQHVSADGTPRWPAAGLLVETDPEFLTVSAASSDGAAGIFIGLRPGASASERVQRVRADGSLALGVHGIVPTSAPGDVIYAIEIGGAFQGRVPIVSQALNGACSCFRTRCQMLDTTGTWRWPGFGPLLSQPNAAMYSRAFTSADGSVTVGLRTGSYPVILAAQRLTSDGSALWQTPAAVMAAASGSLGDFNSSSVGWVPTGDGGIIAFFPLHEPGGSSPSQNRLRAQHLDAYGRLGDTSPRIESLMDSPGDDGGWLDVRWRASCLEGDSAMAVTGYDLVRISADGIGGENRELIAMEPASGDSFYVAHVPTLADSVSPTSDPTGLLVMARDGSERSWASAQRSAHSFPNPPPLAVPSLAGPAFELSQPWPSPATSVARIRYRLPERGHVSLRLVDAAGRRVRLLVNEVQAPGPHIVNVTLSEGTLLAPGLYFVGLETAGRTLTRRLAVVR